MRRTGFMVAALVGAFMASADAACTRLPMPNTDAGTRRLHEHHRALNEARSQGVSLGCASLGQKCGLVSGTYYACVDSTAPDATCDKKTGMCINPPTMAEAYGTSCTPAPANSTDFPCNSRGSSDLQCMSNKCVFSNAEVGHSCMQNSDCASKNCDSMVCAGAAEGTPCQYNGCDAGMHCAYDMKSMKQVCQKDSAIGAACDYGNPCAIGATCNHATKKCVGWFSQPNGANVTGYVPIQCQSGYITPDPSHQGQFGTCASPPTTTKVGQPCTDNEDGYSCICPLGSPAGTVNGFLLSIGFMNGPLADQEAFMSCARASGCPISEFGSMSPNVGSCLYYACNSHFITNECDSQMGMFGAGGAAKVMTELNYPMCMVDLYEKIFGSLASCKTYEADCQKLTGSTRTCQ